MEYSDDLLQEAFKEAELALEKGEVPVGAVFFDIDQNKIIARGCNSVNATKNATRHAEINCIDQVLLQNQRSQWEKIVVYVNVEPCIMCASALVDLKVAAVFFGCNNDRFGGSGSVLNVPDLLRPNNCTLFKGGFRQSEAVDLLKKFYKGENPNAPVEKRKPARE